MFQEHGGPGSKVSHFHIKQVVSALEDYRFNHQDNELYAQHPEGKLSLRDDPRISMFEKNAQAHGPEHAAEAHSLKATGSSAGMSLPS